MADKAASKDHAYVVTGAGGRRIDASRFVMGVGYVYDDDGQPISEADRATVDRHLAAVAKRTEKEPAP